MKSQPAVPVRTICLGIAAVVFAALAIFMFVSPNAPRLVANTTAAEPETLLTLYEGPKTMKTSQNAAIKVNGNDLFVYDIMVNHEHIWNANTIPTDTPVTYFDFDGEVKIDIDMPGLNKPIEGAVVLPASWGIVPMVV